MAVHLVFHKTCDRCGKPFDTRNLKLADGLPAYEPQPLVLTKGGKQMFSFTDLCGKCDEVITKFVERICLDEKPITDESAKPAEAEKGAGEQSGKGAKKESHPF